MISAPASARAIAAAWPIPLVPPVTRAVCPSNENNFSIAEDILITAKMMLDFPSGEVFQKLYIIYNPELTKYKAFRSSAHPTIGN